MTLLEIQRWLAREFDPIKLATPGETIEQHVLNAVRYWNNHSAYRFIRMYNATTARDPNNPNTFGTRIQISSQYKHVAQVFPASDTEFVFRSHPLWTLLGFTIVDNVTSDLILLGETYRNYRYYIGEDFKWQFEPEFDPAVGGFLYLHQLPIDSNRVAVVGSRRIVLSTTAAILTGNRSTFTQRAGDTIKIIADGVVFDDIDMNVATVSEVAVNINGAAGQTIATLNVNGFLVLTSLAQGYNATMQILDGTNSNGGEANKLYAGIPQFIDGIGDADIVDQYILDFLLYYSKALLQQAEGRLLRKGDIIGAKNDGDTMMKEGKQEQTELEKRLSYEGRWLALTRKG